MSTPLIVGAGIVTLILIANGLHHVDEGHLGIYWRGGALLDTVSEPGFHTKLPLVTSFAQIQTSLQTDRVLDIPCGTSGGVLITFESVEVVNRLKRSHVLDTVSKYSVDYDKIWIFDKIHHEINQFCSSHTLQEVYITLFDTLDETLAASLQADIDKWDVGLEIIAARVTKPQIPKQIRADYERMEGEKTKLLITTQRQKVIEKEAETERLRAMINAEKQSEVSKINMEREVMDKLAFQKTQAIEDRMYTARQKALADAQYYKQQKLAEANALKLTDSYLTYQSFLAIRDQPKTYFGASLPDMFAGFNGTSAAQSGGPKAAVSTRGSTGAKAATP